MLDMLSTSPKPAKTDGADEGLPLETLVAYFEDAEEATRSARQASERDRDYYDGKQFTAAELKALRDRGQPDIVINRIQPKVNFLLGWEASNRTDPRAFPRTPQDEDASEAATDALRYTDDATELKQHFSTVWENMLVEGFGGIELTVEPGAKDGDDPEIVPVGWHWDRLFYDPHSRKPDYSDARYLGGIVWMDAEDAKKRWPDHGDEIERLITEPGITQTFDDRPSLWVSRVGSGKRQRVMIVQMYHVDNGVWYHCTFAKNVKLDSIRVPFVDQHGRSWCPLLLQSAFVNRENARYGLVRSMIGVQDEINKRRSKALHRLTMRQAKVETGAVDDLDKLKAELAKPDGVFEINPGFDFEILGSTEQLQAELTLLQEAKNEIELLGPNAAMLGKDKDAPSGRAILANQQGGQTEISLLLDRHRHLKRRAYQRIWDLIRQYKKAPWWIRVTDDEKNVKFVGINKPVTMRDELISRAEQQGMPPEMIEQRVSELAADPMMAERLEQVVRTANQATEMSMDITIEEVPDSANVQMEQFEQLTRLAPAVVFPPAVYIEASSLRNKKRLLEIMQSGEAEDPMQAEVVKITTEQAIKKTEAEIDKLTAEAMKIRSEAVGGAEGGEGAAPQQVDPGAVAIEHLKKQTEQTKAEAAALAAATAVRKAELDREAMERQAEIERENIALKRQVDAETTSQKNDPVMDMFGQALETMVRQTDEIVKSNETLVKVLKSPRRVVRDESNRILGMQVDD